MTKNRLDLNLPIQKRLEARFIPEPNSGCWLWIGYLQGSIKDYGKHYGRISIIGSKSDYAHRVSYLEFKGAIPLGYDIDHLCRNPVCINPDHLEAVTHKENIKRAYRSTEKLALRDKRSENMRRRHARRSYEDRVKIAAKIALTVKKTWPLRRLKYKNGGKG